MAFGIGTKTLLAFCKSQDALGWHQSKVTPELFSANEQAMYEWVSKHLTAHHALPQINTLETHFPECFGIEVIEPPSYYLRQLENKYCYNLINQANLASQEVLLKDSDASDKAAVILKEALHKLTMQKFRQQVMDLGLEGSQFVMQAYHNMVLMESVGLFGWDYMDNQCGGLLPGDIISFVGRPAAGKTWLTLYTALKNWLKGNNVLFVSMEMGLLPISQRITAMYTHTNVSQLKTAGFSSATYHSFKTKLQGMKQQPGKFYLVNGNLAANMEDIYALADQLQCSIIVIDGAYLVRHKNSKLDRFNRVAENCELMKQYNEALKATTFCSWQFNRDAVKNSKKSGKQETNLEDIGYSDAIGQISSIVCGLWQEEGVEVMQKRNIRLMKGRNGEIGQFSINWDFDVMNFDQNDPPLAGQESLSEKAFEWL